MQKAIQNVHRTIVVVMEKLNPLKSYYNFENI